MLDDDDRDEDHAMMIFYTGSLNWSEDSVLDYLVGSTRARLVQ